MLRALRSSKPSALRVSGRRFSVCSALIWPASRIGVMTFSSPSGCWTHVPLYALDPIQVQPHQLNRGEPFRSDRLVNGGYRRFLDAELLRACDRREEQEGHQRDRGGPPEGGHYGCRGATSVRSVRLQPDRQRLKSHT
jgi:hypothetical protein